MHKPLHTIVAVLLTASAALPLSKAMAADHDTQAIEWPMQPGESLRDLAALIYPHNRAMQQRLIAATLRLNGEALAGRTADQPFEQGGDILLPDPRGLSAYAAPAHKRKPVMHKAKVKSATMPANPVPAAEGAPAAADVDKLEHHNQTRKQTLDTLNQRLDTLQTEAAKMQETIKQNKATLPPASKP